MLASHWHMHTVDIEELILCVKITSCVTCRQVGGNFLIVIDLPPDINQQSARLPEVEVQPYEREI